jgi:hypothetical protein
MPRHEKRRRVTTEQPRFELGGYYLDRPHHDRGGYWYAFRYDASTRKVRGRSLKERDFERAKIKLAALVAVSPSPSRGIGRTQNASEVLTTAVLKAYLDERAPHIASEEAADRSIRLVTEYLDETNNLDAPVSFWTKSRQLEFAKWCVAKHQHGAGYIERIFNVMRAAFNDACEIRIRRDAVGDEVEAALIEAAPRIVWKRDAIAKELKIPVRRPRPALSRSSRWARCWMRSKFRTCSASPS